MSSRLTIKRKYGLHQDGNPLIKIVLTTEIVIFLPIKDGIVAIAISGFEIKDDIFIPATTIYTIFQGKVNVKTAHVGPSYTK